MMNPSSSYHPPIQFSSHDPQSSYGMHSETDRDSDSTDSSVKNTDPSSSPSNEASESPDPRTVHIVDRTLRRTSDSRKPPTPVWNRAGRASDSYVSNVKTAGPHSSLKKEASESLASKPVFNGAPSEEATSGESGPSTPNWKRVVDSPVTQKKPSLMHRHRQRQPKSYQLCEVPPEELVRIQSLLAVHREFTERYDFRIQKVTHEVLERQFDAKVDALNLADNQALMGSWKANQEQEIREDVERSIQSKKTAIKAGKVFTLIAFHATKKQFQEAVLKAGLHYLAKTDQGYFGQGIYFTTYPEYSVLYGGRAGGVIFICEIAFRTLFPVATSDSLMGQPIRPGFDGHAIHVVPKTDNPNEMMFVCRGPRQKTRFDEIVVRDPSQTVIRYVMEYKPKASFASQISEKRTRDQLRQLISDYMKQYPSSDQTLALIQKLDEIESSQEELLDPNETDLCSFLQRSIGERDLNTQKNLGERIQKLLRKNDSPEILASQLPSTFIEEQDRQELGDENLKRADRFLSENDYRKALAAYQEVLKDSSQSFRAHVGCGSVYYQSKDWDRAIFHFKEALKIKPKDVKACQNYVFALVERANESITKKSHGRAARDLLEALNYDSSNCVVLRQLANLYFYKDCHDQAYCMASRALVSNPHDEAALRVRGACYASFGKRYYAAAIADLNKSLQIKPHIFAFIHRARLHMAMNCLTDAQKDCDSVLENDRKNSAGWMIKAKISLMQKDHKQAEKALKKCEKVSKDEFAFLALKGECCLQKGKLSDALSYLNKSIETYTKWLETEQAKKVKILKKKDHEDYYEILLLRAKLHHQMNCVPKAISDFQQAIDLFPHKPEAYQCRGNLYRAEKDADKAQRDAATVKELERLEDER